MGTEGKRMMMVVGDTYIVLVQYQVYSKHLMYSNSLNPHFMRQVLLFSLLHRGGNRHREVKFLSKVMRLECGDAWISFQAIWLQGPVLTMMLKQEVQGVMGSSS